MCRVLRIHKTLKIENDIVILVKYIRTRIRCPLCGHVVWEKNIKNAPHNVDIFLMTCQKSKGKGFGRNKFRFIRIFDKNFEHRVLEFLYQKIKGIEQYLKIRLGGEEWRKSKNVWIVPVQDTSYLTTTGVLSNQKINVTPSRYLTTSKKNLKK